MKKRRVFSLLVFGIFSASCGSPSTSLDTSATNDIDYYWDAIQYDPSPNGYARFQDGWYEGAYVSDGLSVIPNDPSFQTFSHSEEKIRVQIDWPQDDNMASHVFYPKGVVTAWEGQYYYEWHDRSNGRYYELSATSSIAASNGRFCLNQTVVRVEDNQETTEIKSFCGPFDGLELHTPWEHVYLQQKKYGAYSFSKETSKLEYRTKGSDSEYMGYGITSIQFSPDLYAVQSIEKEWDSKSIEKDESGIVFCAGASQGSYSFFLLNEASDIEVHENGEKLEKCPFSMVWFATTGGLYLQ